MNVYTLPIQQHTVPDCPRAIAVGMFDGLHIGHRAVLSSALMQENLTPAVFTFSYADKPKNSLPLLTAEKRREGLAQMEFVDCFEADFDAIRNMSPAEFVDMLQHDLGAKTVVCGFNFRFGKNGSGDVATLKNLCDARGMCCIVAASIAANSTPVSSTRIKDALTAGDMQTVTRLLNVPYTITAPVKNGRHLGRKISSPTINQPLAQNVVLPRFGVYASLALVDGKSLPAVTNIGVRPTVGSDAPLAETYILNYNGDLYGKEVAVQLVTFLRDEQTFPSLDALKVQIAKDIQNTHAVFAPKKGVCAVVFDFDNTLTARDRSFENFCYSWLDTRFPQMDDTTRAETARKLCIASYHGYGAYDASVLAPLGDGMATDALFADFLEYMKIGYPRGTVVSGDTETTLAALREKGYKLGLLTNGSSVIQNRKVDVAGLRPYFDCVIVGGDEGIQKPEKEVFVRMAQRLGVAPQNCIFVGDNVRNDIAGAQNAGMQAVFIDHHYPDFTVQDETVWHIEALRDLLTRL